MDETPTRVDLVLMGDFSLRVNGCRVDVPISCQRIVAYLALQARAVCRRTVATALWSEKSEERATANLRTVLWRLQGTCQVLVTDAPNGSLSLAAGVEADHQRLRGWAQRLHRGEPRPGDLDVDLAELSSELLPAWYEDWVLIERERVRQWWLHALESLSAELVRIRRFSEAIEAALLAVAAEPLRESAHRAVMLAHLAEGNYSEALRQFERCEQTLHRDLGVAPSMSLRELLLEVEPGCRCRLAGNRVISGHARSRLR
jgi:DNA-binding SARP family transcriptional activator